LARARVFWRYTHEARRAIFFARVEAIHQRAEFITPAHLLAGLDWESDRTSARIYSLKEHAVALRALTGIPHHPTTETPYLQKHDVGLDDDAKKVLAYTALEADADWDAEIDTDHLVRGILRFPNVASAALESISLNVDGARASSRLDRARAIHLPRTLKKLKFFFKVKLHYFFVWEVVRFVLWMIAVIVLAQVLLAVVEKTFPNWLIH